MEPRNYNRNKIVFFSNKFFFLFLLLHLVTKVNASVNWERINSLNSNIPSDDITGITKDSDGNIWISTYNGFAKYLGQNQWEVHHNPLASPWNDVCLNIVSQDSIIWVGTVNGLLRYCNGNTFVYTPINSTIGASLIYSLAVEGKYLWIGTADYGVYYFDQISFINYTYNNTGNMPLGTIYSILIDSNSDKWFACLDTRQSLNNSHCLVKFDNSLWQRYDTSNSGIPKYLTSISQDNNDLYWLTGVQGPLVKYNNNNWITFDSTNIGINAVFREDNIAIDVNNRKWISNENGFAAYNDTLWQFYDSTNSDFPNSMSFCHFIFIDSLNNKWIGTRTKGIIIFNENGVDLPVSIATINENDKKFAVLNFKNLSLQINVFKDSPVHINIYDINGNILNSNTVNCFANNSNEYYLDFNNISAGFFSVVVFNDKQFQNFKLLYQH